MNHYKPLSYRFIITVKTNTLNCWCWSCHWHIRYIYHIIFVIL